MSSVEEEEWKKEEIIADEASRVAAIHARREYMAKLRGQNPPYFVKSASVVEQDKEEEEDKDKDKKKQRNQKKKEKARS